MSVSNLLQREIDRIVRRFRNIHYRKSFSKCGKNSEFFGRIHITNGQSISIGEDCKINEGVCFFAREDCKISIGNRVTISPNCVILSSEYDLDTWMADNKKIHKKNQETIIGNDNWICSNSVIRGGIHITGHHVVIAAGSVVIGDIKDDYCLYGGIPAKKIKDYK